jgi:hypothetical protein
LPGDNPEDVEAALREVRVGDAAELGLTLGQLRGPAWVSPAAGVRLRQTDAATLAALCRAIQLVLPDDAVFTHLTSASLRGLWLPRLTPLVIACTDGDAPHLDRRGVYVRRCNIPRPHRTAGRGVRIASAPWTLVELAEHFSLIDLVVAMDSALQQKQCTYAELSAAAVPGRRGVRVYRRALSLCDGRSESAWETVLRLLHVLGGIPDVRPQAVIRDARGIGVARADLRIGRRRLHEYDGADHRGQAQHQIDLRREKTVSRLGLERYGYTAIEIHRGPGQILRDAEDALGLDHDPSRVHAWLEEYERSSFSDAGARELAARLRRFDRQRPPRR